MGETVSIFLETNHLMARKPSDAGDPVAMKNAGFGALFVNVATTRRPTGYHFATGPGMRA